MVHLSSVKSIDDRVTLFSCCGSPMHNGLKSFHKKPILYLANMAASSSQFSCPSGVGGGVNGSYLEWHLSSVKSIDDRLTLFSCCGSPMQNGFKFFSRGVFHLYNYEHPHFHEIFMVLIRGICNTVPNSFSVVKHIFEVIGQLQQSLASKFANITYL